MLIDRYAADEPRGYPTLCKGRFEVGGQRDYAIEEPTSLNTLALLPQLIEAGVSAIKIEGRQRSPSYVAEVTACVADRHRRCRVGRALFGAAGMEQDAGRAGPRASSRRWAPTTGPGGEGERDMDAARLPRRFGFTVGPLQYWWPRDQMLAFYAEVAEQPGGRHGGVGRGHLLAPQ